MNDGTVTTLLLTVALALGCSGEQAEAVPQPTPERAAASAAATPADATVYDAVARHYEAIRLILLHDSADGVVPHAAGIRAAAEAAAKDVDPVRIGVAADDVAAARAMLPALAAAAVKAEHASDLAATRDAFYELSQAMAKYRELVPSPSTVVVFCPMAEKAWIQPDGEIGNPYHGQEMPRCGRIVSR